MKILIKITVTLSLLVSNLSAQDYTIKKEGDGPFAMKIGGAPFNAGSSLERKSVILNHPKCPMIILSNSIRIENKDGEFQYKSSTDLRFSKSVAAISWTQALYDVFGRHIQDLHKVEIKDYTRGWGTFPGTWTADQSIFGEGFHTQLTAVTYISRVRLKDGTVWHFNERQRDFALLHLNLLSDKEKNLNSRPNDQNNYDKNEEQN